MPLRCRLGLHSMHKSGSHGELLCGKSRTVLWICTRCGASEERTEARPHEYPTPTVAGQFQTCSNCGHQSETCYSCGRSAEGCICSYSCW